MTTNPMCARPAEQRPLGAAPPTGLNPATLIAVTLFFAVLIVEGVFVALNAPSIADLGALAAVAGSVP
jgi:hypothetical protein